MFNFHVFQTANKFHIISNLTNWHFSCRPSIKQLVVEFDELTREENQALSRFKKLLLKYDFGSFKKSSDDLGKFLGIPFITSPDEKVWKVVKSWVEEDECQVIRRVFDVFEKRFQGIWRLELPKLETWREALDREMNNSRYGKLEDDLKTFFAMEPLYDEVDVLLLISTKDTGGGGANMGPGKITLECSGRSLDHLGRTVMGLYHELAHLNFGKGSYEKLLESFVRRIPKIFKKHPFAKQKMEYRVLINEGVVSNLLPEGYLREKYAKPGKYNPSLVESCKRRFGSNLEHLPKFATDFGAWRMFCALKMFDVTRAYIENRRVVDEAYLRRIHKTFEKFVALSRE